MHYGRYVFSCVFEDDAILPPYKGSTLRGIFGHALKKVVCALKKQDCKDCLLVARCIYPAIFEILPPSGLPTGQKRIVSPPHPYVIEPSLNDKTNYQRDDSLDFTLLIFGTANEYLPYFIYAFDQMGQMGIGKRIDGKRASFFLKQVTIDNNLIYSKSSGKIQKQPSLLDLFLHIPQQASNSRDSSIQIKLETPLRLKYQNTLNADLPFHVLTRAMLRRISSLFEYYGGGEPKLDYRGLIARAKDVAVKESHVGWYDWRRYSNRQEQAMMMGGMTGSITYYGQLEEYLPLLRFCEQVHIGKQTAFGLGKIAVRQL